MAYHLEWFEGASFCFVLSQRLFEFEDLKQHMFIFPYNKTATKRHFFCPFPAGLQSHFWFLQIFFDVKGAADTCCIPLERQEGSFSHKNIWFDFLTALDKNNQKSGLMKWIFQLPVVQLLLLS